MGGGIFNEEITNKTKQILHDHAIATTEEFYGTSSNFSQNYCFSKGNLNCQRAILIMKEETITKSKMESKWKVICWTTSGEQLGEQLQFVTFLSN